MPIISMHCRVLFKIQSKDSMGKMVTRDALSAGMILDQPVINKFGQTLLPAGIEVTESKIELLKTWGVKAVWISATEEEAQEINDEDKVKAALMVRRKMSWKPRNALEYELFNLAFQTELKNLKLSQRDTTDAARS